MPGTGSTGPASPPRGGRTRRRRHAATAPRRGLFWRLALPAVLLAAGVLFATSAETSKGSDLRGGRRGDLSQLIDKREDDVRITEARAALLRRRVEETTRSRSKTDARLVGPQREVDALSEPAGLTAVRGPALSVRLDDAPRAEDGTLPSGANPDDVVVHQQDVQAVVNALWAGGAEAMTIMGIRVISTSAVRCVGNTLLLQGRTYSPPFVVTAIGNASSMRDALDRSPEVSRFRRAARDYRLGYRVTTPPGDSTLPAYDGPTTMRWASPPSRPSR